jgi:hypothetical protein
VTCGYFQLIYFINPIYSLLNAYVVIFMYYSYLIPEKKLLTQTCLPNAIMAGKYWLAHTQIKYVLGKLRDKNKANTGLRSLTGAREVLTPHCRDGTMPEDHLNCKQPLNAPSQVATRTTETHIDLISRRFNVSITLLNALLKTGVTVICHNRAICNEFSPALNSRLLR